VFDSLDGELHLDLFMVAGGVGVESWNGHDDVLLEKWIESGLRIFRSAAGDCDQRMLMR
jgi:hypothetical protein